MTGIWLQDPPTCGSELGTSPGALVLSWSRSLGHLAKARALPSLSLCWHLQAPTTEEVGIYEEGCKEGELASLPWGSLFPAYQTGRVTAAPPHHLPWLAVFSEGWGGEGAREEQGRPGPQKLGLHKWVREDARDQAAHPGPPRGPWEAPGALTSAVPCGDVQSSCVSSGSHSSRRGEGPEPSQQFLELCHCLRLPALELITQTHVGHTTPSRGLDPAPLREPQAQVLG